MSGAGRRAVFWRCSSCGTQNPWKSYITNCLGCGAPRPAATKVAEAAAHEASKARDTATATADRKARPGGRWLRACSFGYAGLILIVLILVRWLGDRWWLATVLLFMPRGLWLLPVVALAALAGWKKRQQLWWLHAATALAVIGPLMGLSVPLGALFGFGLTGPRVRILTINEAHGSMLPHKLIALLEDQKVQIVCRQEHYSGTEGVIDPALEEYFSRGWHRTRDRTIASRWPIVEELPALEDADASQAFWRARLARARIRAPSGAEFVVASVHMPTMYYAFGDLFGGRLSRFKRHIAWRAERMGLVAAALGQAGDLPLLVAGDFNMPSDSTVMFYAMQMAGLHYAFDSAGWGFGYTRPASLPWVRIDHILGSSDWQFTRCWVGPNLGSDHLPLFAEALVPAPQSAARGGPGTSAASPAQTAPRPEHEAAPAVPKPSAVGPPHPPQSLQPPQRPPATQPAGPGPG